MCNVCTDDAAVVFINGKEVYRINLAIPNRIYCDDFFQVVDPIVVGVLPDRNELVQVRVLIEIHRGTAVRENDDGDLGNLLSAFSDELANRHAFGHFASEARRRKNGVYH